MRYAILGDIHSNIQALDAILAEAQKHSIDRYISVGDVVGYGADPVACIERLQRVDAVVVAGNHDWATIGRTDTTFFNSYAKAAVEWTTQVLKSEHKEWLARRPLTTVVDGRLTIAHATLHDPSNFDYIQSYSDAARSLNQLDTEVCFVGHSHVPLAFLVSDRLCLSLAHSIDLSMIDRALINVGSIGQPRDENPKAAYAIYDGGTRHYALHRVNYDIAQACARILAAGLPDVLAERLRFGR